MALDIRGDLCENPSMVKNPNEGGNMQATVLHPVVTKGSRPLCWEERASLRLVRALDAMRACSPEDDASCYAEWTAAHRDWYALGSGRETFYAWAERFAPFVRWEI